MMDLTCFFFKIDHVTMDQHDDLTWGNGQRHLVPNLGLLKQGLAEQSSSKWGTQVVLSYLVGGWPNHLEKYEFVNGMIIPYIMKNKNHVPNRQTVLHGYQWQSMVLNGNSWWFKLVSATSSNQTHLPIIQHMGLCERGCRPVPANTWSSYPNETAVWDARSFLYAPFWGPKRELAIPEIHTAIPNGKSHQNHFQKLGTLIWQIRGKFPSKLDDSKLTRPSVFLSFQGVDRERHGWVDWLGIIPL